MTAGYAAHDYGYGDYYYGPSVDGTIVRDLPSHEFAQGHFAKVPLLVDRDGYEGYGFSNASVTTLAEERRDLGFVFPAAKMSFFGRLWEVYPSAAFNSTFFQRVQVFGDFIVSLSVPFFPFLLHYPIVCFTRSAKHFFWGGG